MAKHEITLEELREAATPLIKLLNEKAIPHDMVIVSQTSVELFEGKAGVHNVMDFVKD